MCVSSRHKLSETWFAGSDLTIYDGVRGRVCDGLRASVCAGSAFVQMVRILGFHPRDTGSSPVRRMLLLLLLLLRGEEYRISAWYPPAAHVLLANITQFL